MKENRTTKLYEGLTSKQKAALTLHYIGEQDATEIGRIRSTIEWKSYRCIDAEYSDWRDQFIKFSMLWGLMYWRALFAMTGASHQLARLGLKGTDKEAYEAFEEADENLDRALGRAVALQEALKEVCRQHGLKYDDVIEVAGVPEAELPSDEPDADYQEEMTRVLLECLTPF